MPSSRNRIPTLTSSSLAEASGAVGGSARSDSTGAASGETTFSETDSSSRLSGGFGVLLQRVSWAALAIAALAIPALFPSTYGLTILNQAMIFALIAIGLNFVYGFGGMFSLAQVAFWGIGAYTSALLATDGGVPFPLALLCAILISSLFGVLVGLPSLKLRSHYLTMATLAFAESVRIILMNAESLTHGAHGVRGIPPATLGPLVFDSPQSFYYLSLAFLAMAVWFTVRFRRSRLGRSLSAVRDDEIAAASSGIDVTYLRVLAFVLSAAFAGLAGSLWAHFSSYISPETFDLLATIRFVAMLLVGGAGTIAGPIVGALVLTYLPEWLRFLEGYYMAIYGLLIVAILAAAPRGLVGFAIGATSRLRPAMSRVAGIGAKTSEPGDPEATSPGHHGSGGSGVTGR